MKLQTAVLEAMRCYIGMTENDRSQYRPETMRHLTTLLEAAMHRPEEWDPLKEWVNHHFNESNIEYMASFYPKTKPKKGTAIDPASTE